MVLAVVLLVNQDAAVLVLDDVLACALPVPCCILFHVVVLLQPLHSLPVILIPTVYRVIGGEADDPIDFSASLT